MNSQNKVTIAQPVYTVGEYSRSLPEMLDTTRKAMQLKRDASALENGKPTKLVTELEAETSIVRSFTTFCRAIGVAKDDDVSKETVTALKLAWQAFGAQSAERHSVALKQGESFRGIRVTFTGRDELGLAKFVDRTVTVRRNTTVEEKATQARNIIGSLDRWLATVKK